jgi:hypothetical protein
MTKDEALRLALEALEDIGDEWGFTSQRTVPKRKEAITCLRLVIDAENISSKPMAWEQFYPEMGKPKLVEVQDGECKRCTDGCPACDARKLPEQDWIERERAVGYREGHRAALAQRTWVGLTNEEIKKIIGSDRYSDLLKEVVQIVEAKLRSKNNG